MLNADISLDQALAVIHDGLAIFYAAKKRCPATHTTPTALAPNGRDLQTDWIHVPDDEGEPWGTYCEEWESSAADSFNRAVLTVIKAVKNVGMWPATFEASGDAAPSVPDNISDLIRRTENLLSIYKNALSPAAVTRPRRTVCWAVAGLFLAATVGGVMLFTRR